MVDKLIAHWKSQKMKVSLPASLREIRAFEEQHSVILPPDFCDFYLSANGMLQEGGQDSDKLGFSFWPLSRLAPMLRECAEHSIAVPPVQDPQRYFVFADYLQWSWAYAIRLSTTGSEHNPIIQVGALEDKTVARSFSEFVELYLKDSPELYPRQDTADQSNAPGPSAK